MLPEQNFVDFYPNRAFADTGFTLKHTRADQQLLTPDGIVAIDTGPNKYMPISETWVVFDSSWFGESLAVEDPSYNDTMDAYRKEQKTFSSEVRIIEGTTHSIILRRNL